DDRQFRRRLLQCCDGRTARCQNGIRHERDQFRCMLAHSVRKTRAPSDVNSCVSAVGPSYSTELRSERCKATLCLRIVCGQIHEHTDAPHPLGLLRAPRDRPRHGRAAEQRDELAASHSITSSAWASNVGDIVRPSAWAVFVFNTTWNFVGCSTGRVAGFAPLMILSTYGAARS